MGLPGTLIVTSWATRFSRACRGTPTADIPTALMLRGCLIIQLRRAALMLRSSSQAASRSTRASPESTGDPSRRALRALLRVRRKDEPASRRRRSKSAVSEGGSRALWRRPRASRRPAARALLSMRAVGVPHLALSFRGRAGGARNPSPLTYSGDGFDGVAPHPPLEGEGRTAGPGWGESRASAISCLRSFRMRFAHSPLPAAAPQRRPSPSGQGNRYGLGR